ncbi:MAG: hypothetical protein ABI625_12890, partial [bacterium]
MPQTPSTPSPVAESSHAFRELHASVAGTGGALARAGSGEALMADPTKKIEKVQSRDGTWIAYE